MDEELKNELVSILRELKNGASPAFQELVAQRSTYCGTLAVSGALVALAGVVMTCFLMRFIAKNNKEISEAEIPQTLTSIAMLVGSAACLTFGIKLFSMNLAGWLAPLGRVLEFLG